FNIVMTRKEKYKKIFKYNSCYCSTTVKLRFLKIKNTIKPLIFQHFYKNLPGDLTFEKLHFKIGYKPL
ncbi:hypothetical protein, partial [Clostridium tetani]|uniref:hypothetical protein n=1 Tax=Clostridium tetani TaxID=1513 RepID=UPI001A8E5C79